MSNSFDQENKKIYLSNQIINREALQRGIKVEILDPEENFVALTHKNKIVYLKGTNTYLNNAISTTITSDKGLTSILLRRYGFPIPPNRVVKNKSETKDFIKKEGFPVVIKGLKGSGGKHVFPKISSEKELNTILEKLSFKNKILIEKHVSGVDFRFLVVGSKCVSVVERIPASVTGDGKSKISDLIALKNQKHLKKFKNSKRKIIIGNEILRVLNNQKLSPDFVLPKGKKVLISYTSNQSKGGETKIVTDKVHEDNKKLSEEIAKSFNLKLVGVDIIAENILVSYKKQNLYVIELNPMPGLGGMHYKPTYGEDDDVAPFIVDLLFPETKK